MQRLLVWGPGFENPAGEVLWAEEAGREAGPSSQEVFIWADLLSLGSGLDEVEVASCQPQEDEPFHLLATKRSKECGGAGCVL